jgi:hypothetical protein
MSNTFTVVSREDREEWREKAEYDARWWGSAHAGHINAERVLVLLDALEAAYEALGRRAVELVEPSPIRGADDAPHDA